MKTLTFNLMLKTMLKLEILKIANAFLIDTFDVPVTVRILDVTNCSRSGDKSIDDINKSHGFLDELRVFYCHGLSEDSNLTGDVHRLYICETKLTVDIFKNLTSIKELSVRRCPSIHSLP